MKPTSVTALFVLAALAAAPAAAQAAWTVSYSPSTGLSIQGDAGSDAATLGESSSPRRYHLFQASGATTAAGEQIPGATLNAGSGCTKSGTTVTCEIPQNQVITATLGDGNDSLVSTENNVGDMFLDGGGGNDVLDGANGLDSLEGGDGNDGLGGGRGNDVVEGGLGNDRFTGDAGTVGENDFFSGGGTDTIRGQEGSDTFIARDYSFHGTDLFDGGPGFDTGDYSIRSVGVRLTTDVGGDSTDADGGSGEGDDMDNVESLIGGFANDTIEMTNALPVVRSIQGTPVTTMTMNGNNGTDTIRVIGNLKTNIDPGLGTDTVTGGGKVDNIFSRDAEDDSITCGAGSDFLVADLRDPPHSADCENIDEGAVNEGPNVRFRSRSVAVERDGSVAARLFCPRTLTRRCTGTLEARVGRRGASFGDDTRYSIRPGRALTVEAELPASQRGAARRRNARLVFQSIETGDHGPKTTQRTLPVRRR